jgi:hypothetical protein
VQLDHLRDACLRRDERVCAAFVLDAKVTGRNIVVGGPDPGVQDAEVADRGCGVAVVVVIVAAGGCQGDDQEDGHEADKERPTALERGDPFHDGSNPFFTRSGRSFNHSRMPIPAG